MQEEAKEREEREEGEEREYVVRLRRPKFPKLLPEETRDHFRAARREVLLAVRSLLDAAIERTEPKPEDKGPTKIEVE